MSEFLQLPIYEQKKNQLTALLFYRKANSQLALFSLDSTQIFQVGLLMTTLCLGVQNIPSSSPSGGSSYICSSSSSNGDGVV